VRREEREVRKRKLGFRGQENELTREIDILDSCFFLI
jgi:hypothetical protein